MDLQACIFQVKDSGGTVIGTGFAISPDLVVTCAHVVKSCKARVGDLLSLFFYPEKIELKAEILHDGWNETEDVAFLRLQSPLPNNAMHVGKNLGSFKSKTGIKRSFHTFGYPRIEKSDVEGFWGHGLIVGQILNKTGTSQLQLGSQEVSFGDSGAPVMDDESELIVGMVQKINIPDETGRFRDLAFALSVETLSKLSPEKLNIKEISDRLITLFKVPIQVPSLTEDFVELPGVKQEIKSRLLNCNNSKGILAITAIQGLGGIGKTTLAIIVAKDEEVQTHFSDGILWTTLGQEPNKLSLLNSWIQELGDSQFNNTLVETASSHLRTLLSDKHILLVIDDVWDSKEVKPFLVGGSSCQTIITTRKAHIADDIGAKCYTLDVMTEEQSLELFIKILGDLWNKDEKEDALKVAKDVGYLPLALSLAAKRRRRNYSWTKLHESLKEEIARLNVLQSPRSLRRGEEGLEASLNLSLKALRSFDEEAWEDFIWLGILHEDVKINKKMASILWNTGEEKAGLILEEHWEEGLLIQDSIIQLNDEKLKTYRIHDLFHYLALQYLTLSLDTRNSTDIPVLESQLNKAHALLLNRYKLKTQKKGLWHTLGDDTYIHSHLTWHMEKAGQIEDIHALLREENECGKNGWYETLESLGQTAVFIEDLTRAWNLSEKKSEHQIEQGNKTSFIEMEIRYALIYTSINSMSANIPIELLVAFLETKKWTEAKVFIYAQKEPDPNRRMMKLISIYKKTKEKSLKRNILEKALDSAYKIRDSDARTWALLDIAQNLDGQEKEDVIENALTSASKIKDDYKRAWVLSAIARNLDGQKKEEVIKNALTSTSKILSDDARAEALSAIIPCLDGQEKEDAIENALISASRIQFESARTMALLDIVPNLDGKMNEKLTEKALILASKIKNNYKKVQVLLAIFPKLDGGKNKEVIKNALASAFHIENDNARAEALSAIVPHLDGEKKIEVMEKALDSASLIKDDDARAEALLVFFPKLVGKMNQKLMEKALTSVHKIKDDLRVKVLSAIVPCLDGQENEELVRKALDVASNFQNDSDRRQALIAIVPLLNGKNKEELMEKALDMASKIQYDSYRVEALIAIVPHLDGKRKEELMEKALNIASEIEKGYHRVEALVAIVPHLDGQRKEELMEKALDMASKIKNDSDKVKALIAIVPHLDGKRKEELMEKALDMASKIKNDSDKVEALIAIVPHFDGQRKEELIEKAFDTASKIRYDSYIVKILIATIPHLDGQRKKELMEKALDMTSKIENDSDRVETLVATVPCLDGQENEELVRKVLDVASNFQNDSDRRQAFIAIVPLLNGKNKEELMEKALDMASKIQYDSYRVEALIAIVPHLDGKNKEELMEKALNMASKIKNDYYRESALSALIPHLDGKSGETIYLNLERRIEEKVIEKSLTSVSNSENDCTEAWIFDSERAMGSLDTVPKFDEQKKEETVIKTLTSVSKINDDFTRVKALLDIVPYLDGQKREEVIDNALTSASKIKNNFTRVKALSAIIPCLDGQKKEDAIDNALTSTSKIKDDFTRVKALGTMLLYLGHLSIYNLLFWWRKAIKMSSEFTRSSLLVDITTLIPVIHALGEDEAFIEISEGIMDVCRWWP
jgi:hypothetical protein